MHMPLSLMQLTDTLTAMAPLPQETQDATELSMHEVAAFVYKAAGTI
jgi:hypothetical protein